MTESLLFRVLRSRTEAVQAAVQSWPVGAADARVLLDLEDAVRECLTLPGTLKQFWNTVFRRLADGQIPLEDLDDLRDAVERRFDDALDLVRAVRQRSQELTHNGAPGDRASEFAAAEEELQRMKHFIFEHWSRFDAKDAEESLAAIARGEYQTTEEILRELQGRNCEVDEPLITTGRGSANYSGG
jgi:hypothetical protein